MNGVLFAGLLGAEQRRLTRGSRYVMMVCYSIKHFHAHDQRLFFPVVVPLPFLWAMLRSKCVLQSLPRTNIDERGPDPLILPLHARVRLAVCFMYMYGGGGRLEGYFAVWKMGSRGYPVAPAWPREDVIFVVVHVRERA